MRLSGLAKQCICEWLYTMVYPGRPMPAAGDVAQRGEENEFYNDLQALLNSVSKDDLLILVGDLMLGLEVLLEKRILYGMVFMATMVLER